MSEAPTIDTHSSARGAQPLVTELRDRLIERLGHAVHRMMEKVDDALFELAEKSENIANQSLYFDAMREVRLKRASIEDSFRIHFSEAFDARARRPDPASAASPAPEMKEGEWGLVDDDAVEEQIAVNNLSDKVSNTCREELYALDQRVSALLGAGSDEALVQPAAPEVVCDSIRRSLTDLQSGLKVRLIILKLFDRYVAGELLVIYHDCNEWMVSKGILPELRTQLRNPRTGRSLVAATSPTGAASGGEPAQLDEASLVQALRSLLTGEGMPGGLGGRGGPVAVAGSLTGLTALQRGDGESWSEMVSGDVAWVEGLRGEVNVLRSLKGTGVARAFGPAGDLTIDIVAMLFDYILDDRSIPSALRALIGRLQIPVVKVALLDTGFFSRKSHPARRLLNTLAEASAGWTGVADETDPLYSTMEQLVTRVNREFEQDVTLFAEVLDHFERFLVEEGERRQLRAERTRKVIGAREQAAPVRERVRNEVQKRTADGALNDMVRGFLATHWHQLLQLLAQQHGMDSAPWRDALLTMDDLLASVTPKTAMEDRRRLSALLPDLLARLKAGMERIEVPAPARKRFLMDLARVHSDAVRGRDTSGTGEPILLEETVTTAAEAPAVAADAWPPEFDAAPAEAPANSEAAGVSVAEVRTAVAPVPASTVEEITTPAEALLERTLPDATVANEDGAAEAFSESDGAAVLTVPAELPAPAATLVLTTDEAAVLDVDAPATGAALSVAETSFDVAVEAAHAPDESAFPALMDAAAIPVAADTSPDFTRHDTPADDLAASDLSLEFASDLELEAAGMLSAAEVAPMAASTPVIEAPAVETDAIDAVSGEQEASHSLGEAPVPDHHAQAIAGPTVCPAPIDADGEAIGMEADTVQRLHAPALPPIARDASSDDQVAPLPRTRGAVMPFELSQRQARRITEDLVRLTGDAPMAPVLTLRPEASEASAGVTVEPSLIELSEELTERTQPQENLADVLRARLLQDGEVSLSDLVDPTLIEERLSRTLPEEPLTRTLPQERFERTAPLEEGVSVRAAPHGSLSTEQIMAMMASGEIAFEEVTLSDPSEAEGLSSRIAAEDEHTRVVAELETGTWIEFTEEDGNKRQARLTWINSSTDTFMFTDRRGLKVADRTRNGLIADFRRGAAQLVEQSGTFDQWMGRLMDGLGRAMQR